MTESQLIRKLPDFNLSACQGGLSLSHYAILSEFSVSISVISSSDEELLKISKSGDLI